MSNVVFPIKDIDSMITSKILWNHFEFRKTINKPVSYMVFLDGLVGHITSEGGRKFKK